MTAERVLMALLLGGIGVGCVLVLLSVLLVAAVGRDPGVHHLAGVRVAAQQHRGCAAARPPA